MNPFLLLLLGLFLILLEFYIPGAIMGILGALLILSSIVLFGMENHSGLEIAFFVFGVVVGVIFVIRFAIWRIYSKRDENTIYLEQDQEGYVASSYDQSLIGKEGKVLADLKLSGHILIDGKEYQALSEAGYIPKGKEIIVIGGRGAYLIVKLKKEEV